MTATQPNDRGADPAIAWLAIAPKIMWLVTSILALVTGLRWLDLSPAVMAAALAVPVIGVLLIVVVRRIPSGARRLAPRLVDLAAWLAGPRQASDAESWHADLLGDPEQDHPPEWPRQLRYALGFVGAAVRMRGRDVGERICRPLDWAVATEGRLSAIVVLAATVSSLLLWRSGGLAKVWDDFEQVGVVAAFAWGATTGWRRIRGIVPPARRKHEERDEDT